MISQSLELQPVISQTQPVHMLLVVDTPCLLTLTPSMHWKLTELQKYSKQNNQFPTKTLVELKDITNLSLTTVQFILSVSY